MNLVIAITGATGAIYARILLEELSRLENMSIYVLFSEYGKMVALHENEYNNICNISGIEIVDNNNMFSTLASGSSKVDAMIVVPSTASTMGRIANGCADNLITRCADVMLKERRKLIIALRDTPLSLIHIENIKKITLAGGIVMPLSPSFYSMPQTIEELVKTQTERITSLLGLECERYIFG